MKKVLIVLALIFLVIGGYIYWATRDLPSIDRILKSGVSPNKWTQVLASDGTVILSYGKFRHEKVKLKEVSPHFIDALLATEDRRFYDHMGLDLIGLARAVLRDIRAGQLEEGGSTITQQLVKNVFLTSERSLKRKVREAVLAVQLEQKLSKDEILEMYVNNVYFGEGAYGIRAASEIYFNKKPSQLTVDEAALLAGLPKAPSSLSPFHNKDGAKKRRNEVLTNLKETGKIDEKELEKFEKKGFNLNASGQDLANGDRAPFFNRYVITQVQKQFDMDEQTFWQSGLKIYTTLEPNLQTAASRTVRSQSALYGRNGLKQQAALVSINPKTGAIMAYVGGKNYSTSQFDRVSQALRSPGSLFKVFTYTAAIDKGFEPSRVYLDEPVTYGAWTPHNYDKRHHGYMTLARAFAISNNVVAVKVLNELGPAVVIDLAQRMGLHANLENNLALTLGGSGVTLLDITSAFSVLPNQGVRCEPYAIAKIVDNEGAVVYEHHPMKTEVLNRVTTDTMVAMMMGNIQYGTGKSADIGRPVAGKTGTSDDHRDAWFIGYTPEVITGVWVGNDDNSSMTGITGGSLPATIWKVAMRSYLADRMISNFDLAFARAVTPQDFTGFNIDNLANSETFKPEALENSETAGLQDGILESDPSLPPPVTGEAGAEGVPINNDDTDTANNPPLPPLPPSTPVTPSNSGTSRDPAEFSPLMNQPPVRKSGEVPLIPTGPAGTPGGRQRETNIIPIPPSNRQAGQTN